MLRIGEFSILSKTTIKALRYYEEQGFIKPCHVDKFTKYRYYETSQLDDVSRIVRLREIGLSIKEIKRVMDGEDLTQILERRKNAIHAEISLYNSQLLKINEILKEKKLMQEKIFIKDIPSCIVYYKEGVINDFSEIPSFVLSAGAECVKDNPDLKCAEPGYSFITYLDGEYKEKDIKLRYSEAVETVGKENETIKFTTIAPVKAVCIRHIGAYSNLRESYKTVMKYIEEKGFNIDGPPRECYIDGCWNKEKEEDYLTEIQFPVK